MADWVEYFSRHTPPGNLKEVRASVCEFAGKHRAAGKEIVFVTSGGTRVPLEENAVRFLDNFSMGTRGSASAEYFLEQGYAVVFLHRQGSLRPFTRHFPTEDVLDLLQLKDMPDGSTQVQVNASKVPKLTQVLKIYRQVQTAGTLLLIEYNSLSEYLFLLRSVAESLAPHGPAVMMYLAAAVSDFYIPPQDLLETDMNIISKKAREALAKYSHQVVVSNILQTRKKTVVMITPTQETAIWMSDSELEAGREIEEKIVADLKKMHQHFYTSVVMQGNTRSVIGSEQLCQNTNQSIQSSMQVGHFVTSQIQALPVSQNGGVISGYSTYTIPTSSLTLPAPVVTQIQVVKAQEPPPSQEVSQTSVEELSDSPNSSAQIFGTLSDSCLTADMKAFIESFRARRIALGYTQEDVGNELSHSNGHSSYSQSFISRFESKNLGLKAAEKMKPVLQGWIEQKEQECAKGLRMCKKRKRRTSFSNETLQYLIHAFEQNPKPSSAEIIEISSKLGLEPVTVRVWFCNRKQMMKRMASGKGRPNLSLKAELDAKKQEDQSIEKEPTKLDFTNMPVGQFSFTEDRVKALVCLTSEGSPVKSSRPTVSTTDVSFAQVHDNSIVHSVSGTRNTVPENTQLIEPALISNGVATYETVSNVPLTESQS
ncbi:hypothetical protein pdam_00007066 [Pocillopora damicornis]|uniref:POU domain protein n=1 Tax=Pocillopora damicornis TaxID=46731 RepID=A0A3M6T931_POCDA|nr:hypothetical protein pdam_00007066 [Pocillopora damicornis]